MVEEYLVTCERCGCVWNYFENPPVHGLCQDCAAKDAEEPRWNPSEHHEPFRIVWEDA